MHMLPLGDISLWARPFGPGLYSATLLTAAAVALTLGLIRAVARGLPAGKTALCLAVVGAAAFAGGRMLCWATDPPGPAEDAVSLTAPTLGHFGLYGGLILAFAAGVALCRLLRIDPWTLGDRLVLPAALGIAVARAGCFLRGCCFGAPCELPWAVRYPPASPVHSRQAFDDLRRLFVEPLAVHPTQVYEILAALACAALAGWLIRRKAPAGVPAMTAVAAFTLFRILNEPLRGDGAGGGVNLVLYAGVVIASGAALLWRARRRFGHMEMLSPQLA